MFCPAVMVVLNGCVVTDGAVQIAFTVTTTVSLSAVPQPFVARTQYEVVADRVTLIEAVVPRLDIPDLLTELVGPTSADGSSRR